LVIAAPSTLRLKWEDIDLEASRIHGRRSLWACEVRHTARPAARGGSSDMARTLEEALQHLPSRFQPVFCTVGSFSVTPTALI